MVVIDINYKQYYFCLKENFEFTYLFRILEDRRSHYEPSVPGIAVTGVDVDELDDHDLYVPHFQRVSISGEDTSGVSVNIFFLCKGVHVGHPHFYFCQFICKGVQIGQLGNISINKELQGSG